MQYASIERFDPDYNSSTLILYHNQLNGSILINWLRINGGSNDIEEQQPINVTVPLAFDSDQNKTLNIVKNQNMFDQTFGKYEEKRSLALNVMWVMREKQPKPNTKSGYVCLKK